MNDNDNVYEHLHNYTQPYLAHVRVGLEVWKWSLNEIHCESVLVQLGKWYVVSLHVYHDYRKWKTAYLLEYLFVSGAAS